ncbi:transcriptional regulator, TetR family [Pseudomonas salomonii]|uniref:Transcriptional regulator, TetR family n=2 Tax=Pseudomonas salomonii TaxID=191391 RepID=A0A1H3GA00_9PSED|nr:transcriptional regulator, TetR family [Pseudomonas salomonii]
MKTIKTTRSQGRPREFDMDEFLDNAAKLFCQRGFHGTSIVDISDATNLTCGSLYKAFKDKREVFLSALKRQSSTRSSQLRQAISTGKCGREMLRQALLFYAAISSGEDGRDGCLIVSTTVELGAFDAEIAEMALVSLRDREALLQRLIDVGISDGSIAATVNSAAAAKFMLCLIQGLRVIGKTSPDLSDMETTVGLAMKTLA